jgi:bifunctional DNase/RNase
MTHEIYLKIFERAPVEFEKVEIHSMTEGTYYASIYYKDSGKKRELDARPSDSVSLALRMNIPIFVNKSLMRGMLTPKDVEDFKDIIKTVKF